MNFNSVILLISIFPSGSIWGKSLLMTATCFLSMLAFVFMVYRSAGWSAHSETINPVETFSLYKIKLSLFSSPFQIPFSIDNFIRNWKFFIDNDRWPKHSRLLLLAYFEPQILEFHHGSNYEKKIVNSNKITVFRYKSSSKWAKQCWQSLNDPNRKK